MKNRFFLAAVFFFTAGAFCVKAQDLIILRDGNVIESKVMEISVSEIRYKRFDHLDGPMIVIARADVLSIRYENGKNEIMNTAPALASVINNSPEDAETPAVPALGEPTLLQQTLNLLPEIPIGRNKLKFEFGGNTWIAKVNGRNFLAGSITMEDTGGGVILTLKQTHVYPPRNIPRINWIRTPGPEITLEYKIGPPMSLGLAPRREKAAGEETAVAETPATPAMDPDKLYFSVNADPGGFLLYGPSLGIEFNKGKFYSKTDLIFPGLGLAGDADTGFGFLTSINRFRHTRNGGAYFGLGMGYIYEKGEGEGYRYYYGWYEYKYKASLTTIGLNAGYKIAPSGTGGFFRIGLYLGPVWGSYEGDIDGYNPPSVYFKFDTAAGLSF
jgi:hypothetical protein